MANKKPTKDITVGHAWVALWLDGTPGWGIPQHVGGFTGSPEGNYIPDGEKLYYCEITVRIVRRKDGRPTVRRLRKTS
jgi:hypothetical protein